MLNTQSNTQRGAKPFNSGEDLSAKEGRLAVMVDGGSVPELLLPTAVTDIALFIIDEGGVEDADSSAIPLEHGTNVRIRAKGTGSAGAVLVHADPATPADKGKVRTIPATAGQYFSPGTAEEDFVDGQLVLVRPFPRLVRVATSVALTSSQNATTNGSDAASTQALANALKVSYNALQVDVAAIRTALIAQGILA